MGKVVYEELRDFDILTPAIVELIDSGRFKIAGDKIIEIKDDGIMPTMPWLFVYKDSGRLCRRWSGIYFNMYGIISRNCFNCWKVVCRPERLSELFELRKLQLKLGLNAKCGLETRPGAVHKGIYAAFWYGELEGGLEGARELHKKIEREVHRILGQQQKVILKRACTEMEEKVGPPEGWIFPAVQHRVENYLDAIFEVLEPEPLLSNFVKVHTIRRWIEHARRNRDASFREFVNDEKAAFGERTTSRFEENSGLEPKQSGVIPEGDQNGPDFQRLQDYL